MRSDEIKRDQIRSDHVMFLKQVLNVLQLLDHNGGWSNGNRIASVNISLLLLNQQMSLRL